MTYYEIIFYSLIQGLTEFLPVSSSAHLELLEDIFNWPMAGLQYVLAAHFGTLFAVLWHRREEIKIIWNNSFIASSDRNALDPLNVTIGHLIVSTIPILVVGSLLVFYFNGLKFNFLVIGMASIIGGALLEIFDRINKDNKGKLVINFKISLVAGFYQSLAVIPGISRSGAVMTVLRAYGIKRNASARISLLMGIPIIALSGMYNLYKILNSHNEYFILYTLLIIILSFISALVSIQFLLKWLNNNSFTIFTIYRSIFGFLLIVLFTLN